MEADPWSRNPAYSVRVTMLSRLLSLRGRMSRGTFASVLGAVLVAFVALHVVVDAFAGARGSFVLLPLLYWIALSLCVRRSTTTRGSPDFVSRA